MSRSFPALINSRILRWARDYAGFDLDFASEKIGIDSKLLSKWEKGIARPSITQLRKISKLYHFSIATFYLPEPPKLICPRPKDRRYLPGFEDREISPELNYEFRLANERREIALEMLFNLEISPQKFNLKASLRNSPENIARNIRTDLNVTYQEQCSWNDSRIAFNKWREILENKGILILQSTIVPLQMMRGYSMLFEVYPIIGVNRKDTYNGRSFTLFHELCHLVLNTGSICDFEENSKALSTVDSRIETFCNQVAGCCLVPKEWLLKEKKVKLACELNDEGEEAIRSLSRTYSVSKEVIVRRLLSLGLISDSFYKAKRELYLKEYKFISKRKGGYVSPADNAISASGKPLVGLVLENLNRNLITTSDFSDYLGIKIKHLSTLQNSFIET